MATLKSRRVAVLLMSSARDSRWIQPTADLAKPTAAIRSIIYAQFGGISQDPMLTDAASGLRKLTTQLGAVQKTIQRVGDAVNIGEHVVGAVDDIVKIVTAFA